MASRFYLSSTAVVAGGITPGFAAWTRTTEGDRREMSIRKDGSALTNKSLWAGGTAAANDTALCRQFISQPMAAGIGFVTTDTIKCVIRAIESATNDNINRSPICLKVYAADGSTLQATLFALAHAGPNTTEWNTSLRNKQFADGDTLATNYTTVAGDRLVLEVGGQVDATGGTSVTGNLNFGSSSASDNAENETGTTANNPWFEISRTVTFLVPPESEDWIGSAAACFAPVALAATMAFGGMMTQAAIGRTLSPDQDEVPTPAAASVSIGSGAQLAALGRTWPQTQVVKAQWSGSIDEVPTDPSPAALVGDGEPWNSGVRPSYGWTVPQAPLEQGDLCVQNTRFYFSWLTPPAGGVTPGYAGWTDLALASHNRMATTVDTNDVAAIPAFGGGAQSANDTAIVRQLVSDPMAAGIAFRTIDTIRAIANVIENSSAANLNRLPICLKVYAADGTTLQATLLPLAQYGVTTTEIGTSSEIRFLADGVPLQANYTTVLGDRLVFELGMQVDGTGSAACQGQVSVGSKAQADLPAYETTTGSTLNPWLDISRTITFDPRAYDDTVYVSGVRPSWGWPVPPVQAADEDAYFTPPSAIHVEDNEWTSGVAAAWGWPTPQAMVDTDDAPIPTAASLDADSPPYVSGVAPTYGWRVPQAMDEDGDLTVTAPPAGNAIDDGAGMFRLHQRGAPFQIRALRKLAGGSNEPLVASPATPEDVDWVDNPGWRIALAADAVRREPTWLLDATDVIHANVDEDYWINPVRPTWGWAVPRPPAVDEDFRYTAPTPLAADEDFWQIRVAPRWGWPVPQAIQVEPDARPFPLTIDEDYWASTVRPSWGWPVPLRDYDQDTYPLTATVTALTGRITITGPILNGTTLGISPDLPAGRPRRWTGQPMYGPLVASPPPVFYHARSEQLWRRSVEQKVLQMSQAANTTSTPHTSAAYALSSGWGASRAVSSVAATDSGGRVTISCAGAGTGANPTVTVTFVDRVYGAVPAITCSRGDANAPTTGFWICSTPSATAPVFTFVGTPSAGTSYILDYTVVSNDRA